METVAFKSDEYTLMGSLHLPGDKPAPFVIGCHGLIADRRSPKQVGLAHACCRQGIGYFRFDHRGCGESQGEFNTEIKQVKNIHIFHGEHDEVVPLAHARTLYERASRPKNLTIQPAGDHRMSNPEHQSTFIRESVAWFRKGFFS
jgi:alpha-beta hydrolase superfamily lysophospholipase